MKLLIVSTLFFYLTAAATPAAIDSIKFECPGSVAELSNRIKAMQDRVSIWTQDNPEKADQSDLSSIFSVHLLPESHTMHLLESSCWVSLNDFIEKPSEKNFEYWNACINSLELQRFHNFKKLNPAGAKSQRRPQSRDKKKKPENQKKRCQKKRKKKTQPKL
ncbi:MAG: hypothetical protein IPK04_04395 [Bdellovibrionales bacterium]|nr:hypothetical protein [Bdellovibrionales bacterium]